MRPVNKYGLLVELNVRDVREVVLVLICKFGPEGIEERLQVNIDGVPKILLHYLTKLLHAEHFSTIKLI